MSKANDFYPGTNERVCLVTGDKEAVTEVCSPFPFSAIFRSPLSIFSHILESSLHFQPYFGVLSHFQPFFGHFSFP